MTNIKGWGWKDGKYQAVTPEAIQAEEERVVSRTDLSDGGLHTKWENLSLSEKVGVALAGSKNYELSVEVAALEAGLEAWIEKGALFVEQGDRLSKMEIALQDALCDCSRHETAVQLDPHSPSTHDFSCPYRRKWNEALAGESDERKRTD